MWRDPRLGPTTPLTAYRKAIRLEEQKLANAMRTPGRRAELDVIFIGQQIDNLKSIIAKKEGR